MKKIVALFLAILMTLTVPPVSGRFAAAENPPAQGFDPEGGEAPLDDIAMEEAGPEELTLEEKEALINNAALNPTLTGYEPLDTVVQSIFSRILTDGMSMYDKVSAIYAYLMQDSVYDFNVPTTDYLYYHIWETINYASNYDRNIVCQAYGFLENERKIGVCQHFSSAFMVMTRALGLETYVLDLTGSTEWSISSHECAMLRTGGQNYLFDPVMGVVQNNDEVQTSGYFCTPLRFHPGREYCDMNEMLASYGGFVEDPTHTAIPTTETIPGATEGEVYFSFGRYPQTRVTDPALLAALNGALDPGQMIPCSCYAGGDAIGTQEESDLMRYADVEYGGEKYRAVKVIAYRPIYTYKSSAPEWSYQDNNGYYPGNIYWFRYDPIEWRLLDGGTLLLCELAIDLQPFNSEIYASETPVEINGKVYYNFKDPEHTQPVNDWGTSDVRAWLNSDFLNTAFSAQEQALLDESDLHNYSSHGDYNYPDTTDRIFLLSRNEVLNPNFFLGQSEAARIAVATDYAKCMGIGLEADSGYTRIGWLLRNPGAHSADVSFVSARGRQRNHMKTAAVLNGLRPALRVKNLSALIPTALSAPARLTAAATETGQITLQAAVCNGASSYRFYLYRGNDTAPSDTYDSDGYKLVLDGLTPGETYRFRAAAVRTVNGQEEVSPLSPMASALCRAFIGPPEQIETASEETRKVSLSWAAVDGATSYRVYRFIDSDTLTLCGETTETGFDVSDLSTGYTYFFRISSIPPDGHESRLSPVVSCFCRSIPHIPNALRLTPVSTGVLRLSWELDDAIPQTYHVERYLADGYTEIGTTQTNSFTDPERLYTGYPYYYRVRGETADGLHFSDYAYVYGTCESIPPVPGDLSVEVTATGAMSLSWTASEGAARYCIERYYDGDASYHEIGRTADTGYTVTGLASGIDYYFRVIAETEDGADRSAGATAHGACLSIPPVPGGLTVVPTATGALTLSWTPSEGAARYYVERHYDDSYHPVGQTADATYTVTGLTPGTEYFFRVIAETEDGKDRSAGATGSGVCLSIPPVPGGLTVTPTATGALTLSWTPSEGAALYYVERHYDGSYHPVGQTADTSYAVTGLTSGTEYFFRVIAETEDGKDRSAGASASGVCLSIPPVPGGLTVTPAATGALALSWTASEGAARYRVERFYGADNSYREIGQTTSCAYTVTGLSVGTEYYFRVIAETADGSDRSAGASASGVCVSLPAVPTELTLTPVTTNALRLAWTPSEGAARYHIERYSGGSYLPIGQTEGTDYTVTGLTTGNRYYFRVIAETQDSSSRSNAAYVDGYCLSVPPAPTNLTLTTVRTGALTLSWTASEGAATYRVDRIRGSSYTTIGTTSETSFTEEGLSVGTTYYYRVYAVTADGQSTSTYASVNGECGSYPAKPADLTLTTVRTGALRLEWTAPEGAASYRVDRIRGSSYTTIGTTSETSFTEEGLSVGTTYYYRVYAVTADGQSTSAYASISGECGSVPPVPADFTAETVSTGVMRLRWKPSPGAARYRVARIKGSAYTELAVTANTSYTVSGLTVGTRYYFRVIAESQDGTDLSSPATFDAVCGSFPGVPQNLTAVPSASGAVTLRWDTVEDAAYYNVYRYVSATSLSLVGSTDENVFTHTGRVNGREYVYQVRAVALGGKEESGPKDVRVTAADVENTICAHDYVQVSFRAPTCAGAGLTASTCALCGSEKRTFTPAAGHNVAEWISQDGTATGVCTVCGEVITADEEAVVPSEICEHCGRIHRAGSGPLAKNGILCRLVAFFRHIRRDIFRL